MLNMKRIYLWVRSLWAVQDGSYIKTLALNWVGIPVLLQMRHEQGFPPSRTSVLTFVSRSWELLPNYFQEAKSNILLRSGLNTENVGLYVHIGTRQWSKHRSPPCNPTSWTVRWREQQCLPACACGLRVWSSDLPPWLPATSLCSTSHKTSLLEFSRNLASVSWNLEE